MDKSVLKWIISTQLRLLQLSNLKSLLNRFMKSILRIGYSKLYKKDYLNLHFFRCQCSIWKCFRFWKAVQLYWDIIRMNSCLQELIQEVNKLQKIKGVHHHLSQLT